MEKGTGCVRGKDTSRGREKSTPSYGIVDSQSVKPVYASENRSIDGEKQKEERGISW